MLSEALMSACRHSFYRRQSLLFSFFPKNRGKSWPQGCSVEERRVKRDAGFLWPALAPSEPGSSCWGPRGGRRLSCSIIRPGLSEEMHFPTGFQILINQSCDLQHSPCSHWPASPLCLSIVPSVCSIIHRNGCF